MSKLLKTMGRSLSGRERKEGAVGINMSCYIWFNEESILGKRENIVRLEIPLPPLPMRL
jgi:hypothetical protein